MVLRPLKFAMLEPVLKLRSRVLRLTLTWTLGVVSYAGLLFSPGVSMVGIGTVRQNQLSGWWTAVGATVTFGMLAFFVFRSVRNVVEWGKAGYTSFDHLLFMVGCIFWTAMGVVFLVA